ncbi:uncharacterized protein PG998_004826 [Apiospora kogelbergensis]|uniref:uncharacterized protein n=1 Tax=Apiospora kogelbergensis TaxID=1337665 RepID=UPI00312F6D8E
MASPKNTKPKRKGKGKGKRAGKVLVAAAAEEHNASNVGQDEAAPSLATAVLSTTAVNIKRREDYANMDPDSKERERTRVKRSRAIKMAKDSLAHTAWVELGLHSQAEVVGAITDDIRDNYAAATPGPSSRKAAEYAVHKVFADKIHLFFPKDEKKAIKHNDAGDDTMDVDLDKDDAAEDEDEDDWTPFELGRDWKDIMSAIKPED